MTVNKDIRWKQRFTNFEKAKTRLDFALSELAKEPENILYQMATVQTFEFTFELAWKTTKDYLIYEGLDNVSLPREVLKQGFHHDIIKNGQAWINMLEDRNLLAHTYCDENTKKAIQHITEIYFFEVNQVFNFLKEKL